MHKKKVCIIFTGGTISMNLDKEIGAAVPALSGEQVLALISNQNQDIEIKVINFCNIPGPHITIDKLLELKKLIKNTLDQEDISGVVVTTGTDTLEESAYFIDLTIKHTKPVVFVGAMRNVSELGYDGASNLAAGIQVAVSPKTKEKGVLVVLDDDINLASEVAKTNTSSLDTFQSPYGPVGIIDTHELIIYRHCAYKQYIDTDSVERRVDLIKATLDMDDRFIRSSVDSGAVGIVIEGMGRGNVPLKMLEGIKYALNKGVIVVIVSRCSSGRVFESYGYEGGGKELVDLGVVMGGDMRGLKARIKLMLALGKTKDINILKALFKEQDYAL
ncbi:asparaginase [Cellulosilyticum sp. I15G10I2]|uniref:asparaginase n=1 Tax=Cellulosilyticum sp. I15G10I2 TaxID=1892843 RepID=UPI00085BFFAF|nr:asparaginase [Cellulosilyticum sp. I15G10I2]